MLEITVPGVERWDELKQEFIYTKEQTLRLEHSLVSLSKWESKWKKSFMSQTDRTYEETVDYVKCMTLTQNVDPEIYNCLTKDNITVINDYINDTMTATTFSERTHGKSRNSETVTSELIYYWMIALNIPFECQKWHLNRLLTLVRVCNIKNQPAKKMSKREVLNRNRALNEARKQQLNSKG